MNATVVEETRVYAEPEVVEKADESVTKVMIFGSDTGESRSKQEDDSTIFGGDVVSPIISPDALARRCAESYALRPNIDAYVANVDGYGYRLVPAIDLDLEDADEVLKDAIVMSRLFHDHAPADVGIDADALAAEKRQIEFASRIERLRLEAFLSAPSVGMTLIGVRKLLRRDYETTGNAYLEIVRNAVGEVALINHVPAVSVRMTRLGKKAESMWRRRVSPIDYVDVQIKRQFRRFVQNLGQFGAASSVWFKEFGDLRAMSSRTGRYYVSVNALRLEEQHDETATEILHFKQYDSASPYGSPRWMGALLAVLGGRAAEEINYAYFDEKTIPPGFLLVSGASLKKGAEEKIEQYLRDHIRGRRNFWSIVVIQADSKVVPGAATSPRPTIEWVPMTDQQNGDSLFQKYDERNGEKIGNMFRLPKLLRGDMKDFNRASAQSAIEYAEAQVFQPERADFDSVINELLLPEMGVKYWRFESLGSATNDPELIGRLVSRTRHAMTVDEQRRLIDKLGFIRVPPADADWSRKPFEVYELEMKLGIPQIDPDEAVDDEAGSTPADDATLEPEVEAQKLLRSAAEKVVIDIPAGDFDELFEQAELTRLAASTES